jgi:sucrose phosphorylase
MQAHLPGIISRVHILPFYPYSSDDGFSVIDYWQVDPSLGEWDDVARLGQSFRLMFDAVINHISRHSRWFEGFVRGEAPYTDYFITVDPGTDLSQVVRPRALPLLTPVETAGGAQHVWTTFSDDQIDLNYANPLVLLEIIDLLLAYVEQGAEVIRLDAIAYLWKEIGTTCIHLPQTHRVVKLFRAVLDAVAPGVILITETNVPHEENISYFGDALPGGGTDEAQMVYQFPLAPLVLHAFHTGDARPLTEWARDLEMPPSATFFNFIASHDGIGVRPAEGLLSAEQIQSLVDCTLAHGGQVSYKTNADGSKSVYELNITLYDFLNDPNQPQLEIDVSRFLASQAIMLSLAGVPGIYVHSLFGSRNCYACVEQTGRARSINREKFNRAALEAQLTEPTSVQHQVFQGYRRLLSVRRGLAAFHPNGEQRVLDLGDAFFALLRTPPNTVSQSEGESVLCLVNVSSESRAVQINLADWDLPGVAIWHNVLTTDEYVVQAGELRCSMKGYQVLWLQPKS